MRNTSVGNANDVAVRIDARPWYLRATDDTMRPWLARMRGTAAAIDAGLLLAVLALPRVDMPLRRIALLLAAAAMAHAAIAYAAAAEAAAPPRDRSHHTVFRGVLTASLLIDVLVMTGLLELTGGPFNPFAVLFGVHVMLAMALLGRTPAGLVGACAVAGYGLLLYWHSLEGDADHHRLSDVPTHLYMMWVALVSVAELIAFFLVQASQAISRREDDLEEMRVRAAKSERLAALTTLAAGAAHELSTPLGTIALAARELERAAQRGAPGAALVDDARLIRTEVDRCRGVLDQMSGRAGGAAVHLPEWLDVEDVFVSLRRHLPADRAARLSVRVGSEVPPILAPRAGLLQVLTSLVNNAFDASPETTPVSIEAAMDGATGGVRIEVEDRGTGMTADALRRAGEPFYTTKEPGRGLGLGLFLARVFAERCGGGITLRSGAGGTRVMLEMPSRYEPEPREAA
jgi:two-component system, sensor histidine kinase RegB